MAEESIKTSKNRRRVSTDSSYYGGNSRRNSGGKPTFSENGLKNPLHRLRASTGSFPDIVNSNKNAKGKPSSVNGGESVGPHYLRASTGSCHDFCKYGRKDAVEVKPWRSIPKRVKTPSSDTQNPVKSEVPAEKKTKKVLKSPSILKQEVSSHSKKAGPSLRKVSPKEKKIPEDEKKYSGKHTSLKPKAKTNLPASSHILGGLQGRKNNEIKMGKKVVVTPAALISPKPSMNRVGSLKVKRLRSLKLLSPLKNQKLIREAKSKQPNDEKVPEKTLHVVEVGTEKKIPESVQDGVTAHSPTSPLLSPPRVSSFPKSLASSFHEEEEEEEEFECAVGSDDSISENSDTEKNCKKAPRKSGVYLSEDKNCTPKKLKFRRGKVVELQTENSGPRRLRFRRGRVTVENQNSKVEFQERNFRKRGDEVDNKHITDFDSEKVVLRHQDVQGKKDDQGLFNNVIEETASKLVESRKGKVKALVGAFETVISLQESKPSVQTAT